MGGFFHDRRTEVAVGLDHQERKGRVVSHTLELTEWLHKELQELGSAGQFVECSEYERRLIGGVRPAILEEQGIEAAIERLVLASQGPTSPRVEFRKGMALGPLEPAIEDAIYWIAQTALANACQHSRSPQAQVSLARRGSRLVRLEIRDWGIGFDPAQSKAGHFGLEGIRQRARLLGGHATIDSVPGKGTCVVVELPLVARTSGAATRHTVPGRSGDRNRVRTT